jgi:YggT family protein
MILFANILYAAGYILNSLLGLFLILLIVYVIMSWVNADPSNGIVRFVRSSVEPLLYEVRRRIPVTIGMIDFSPMILMFAIIFLQYAVAQSLMEYSISLKMSTLEKSLP